MSRLPLVLLALLLGASVSLPAQSSGDARAGGRVQPNEQNSLLPGDVVRVRIWREEDLSGEFQVDENGFVVLPLLGRRQVMGISPAVLREQLTDQYAEYLVNPSVNVTLLRRITVLGEVRVPGLYPVDATVSVAALIALAQGLSPDGDADDIRLVREGRVIRSNLRGTAVIGEEGIRSGDQIIVGKRSWISRNIASLVGIVSIITNVIVIVAK